MKIKLLLILLLVMAPGAFAENPCPECPNGCEFPAVQLVPAIYCPQTITFKNGDRPHSTIEILETVYGVGHSGIARVSARILDLRSRGYDIEGWKDQENPSIYWYQLKTTTPDAYKVQGILLESA